ncbi:MAG: DMT family transporter [Paucibacter sp.]|nr:DMT family transporter [Roseateles sp.]
MKHPLPWSGLALAALGAVAFAGKAIIVKLAYRYGVDSVTLLMLRMLFALPLFVALAWWSGRGQQHFKGRDLLALTGLGFSGYYLASFLDFAGLAYVTASFERIVLYLNPTLVLVLGWLLFKRRVSGKQIIAMGVSYSGVFLVYGQELGSQGEHATLGAVLVFASALSYATYLVYSGELVQRLGAMRLTGWASSIACGFCIGQFLLLRPVSVVAALPPQVLWLSLLNAVACTFAPVLMLMMAIERVGAAMAAQVGMIGPMATIAMGALLLGEPFTPLMAAGTLLVMGGVWLLAKWR